MFQKENAARLDAEPIEITLGNVTVPLVPINRARGVPSRRLAIQSIVNNSSTADDWENVLRMVQGFTEAGIPLASDRMEFVVRKLGDAGMQSLIVKAVVRGKETGLQLRKENLIWVVLRQFIKRAEESGWEAEETKKMATMVETIFEALEERQHLGHLELGPGDMRANPLLLGVVAELTARAAKSSGESDVDGKVEKYARRLVVGLKAEGTHVDTVLQEIENITTSGTEDKMWRRFRMLYRVEELLLKLLPLWDALKVSRQVLGREMPDAALAQEWEAKLEKASVQGADMLEKVLRDGFKATKLEAVLAKVKAVRQG